MLFCGALFAEGDKEHAGVQAIWGWLADETVCRLKFILGPVMLDLELLQPLSSGQSSFYPCISTSEVVLGLVEDRFCKEDIEDSFVPLEDLLGEHELSKLVDIEVRLGPLLG